MDLQKIRALAGLPSVKQNTVITPAVDSVLESSDANFIVSALRTRLAEYANVNVKIHGSIKEYLDANTNASNVDALKEALAKISPKASFEQANSLRKMAGLPPLTEKKDEDEETEEVDSEEESEDEVENVEADDTEEDETAEGGEEESEGAGDDVASLVASIANKLLKDGAPEESELADFLMKVYNAGVADAVKKAS